MSRTIKNLGGPPPSLPRVQTFASNFQNGLDRDVWKDEGPPWHYVGANASGGYSDQAPGEQTITNSENQYYLKTGELTGSVPDWPDDKPWFIRNGNLVLSAVPVTSQYDDIAWGVVNGYQVVSSTSGSIRVRGVNYYDRPTRTNRTGIDQHMTAGRQLRVKIGGSFHDISSIVHHNGLPDPVTPATSEHTLIISGSFTRPADGEVVNVLRKQKYMSGSLNTRGTHSQKYGSWEIRCKFPKGEGAFPAAWLWPNYSEFPGSIIAEDFTKTDEQKNEAYRNKNAEVDLVESLGHATDIAYHNLHQPRTNLQGTFPQLNHSTSPSETQSGWTSASIQQHQVLMEPTDADYYDFGAEFVTLRFDWYPAGLPGVAADTCAYYVKRDSWSEFRLVCRSYMSPYSSNGVIDEKFMMLNMAMESDFNFEQEINDENYPRYTGPTAPPWEFEIDYFNAYQWTGYATGGAGLPDANGVTDFSTSPGDPGGNTGGGVASEELPQRIIGKSVLRQGATQSYRVSRAQPEQTFLWSSTIPTSEAIIEGPVDGPEIAFRSVSNTDTLVVGSLQCSIDNVAFVKISAPNQIGNPFETFQWSPGGVVVTNWEVGVGSSPGANDYLATGIVNANVLSAINTTAMPEDGSSVYVTLKYKANGLWKEIQRTYITPKAPTITDPVAGAQLLSSANTFTFSDNNSTVDSYRLSVGTDADETAYHYVSVISGNEYTMPAGKLPNDDSSVKVTLEYRDQATSVFVLAEIVYFTAPSSTTSPPIPPTVNPGVQSAVGGSATLVAGQNLSVIIVYDDGTVAPDPPDAPTINPGAQPQIAGTATLKPGETWSLTVSW